MRRHRETLAGIRDALAQSSIVTPQATELPGLNEYDFHSLVGAYIALNGDLLDGGKINLADSQSFYRMLRVALMAWSRNELKNIAEPWAEFERRVRGTIEDLSGVKGRVLVVTSGGPISAMLREVLALDVETMVNTNLQAKNTGVTRYFTRGMNFSLNMFNAVPHLESSGHRHLITYT